MKVIFRKSKTDDDMLEIITISNSGKETLWTVMHADILHGEGFYLYEETGEQEVEIK